MKNYLLLPLHLDALYLSKTTGVIASSADFSDLPFFDGNDDNNSDNPYVGEGITAKNFENKNLYLEKGIHLHWKLPRALSMAEVKEKNLTFPTVPNRWLIQRKIDNELKHWVVESDYLFPEGIFAKSVTIPYFPEEATKLDYQTYRYMGRKLTLEAWLESKEKEHVYFDNLTAIGYGEVDFASFYPNCHSVFGFHDESMDLSQETKVEYEVMGWYSNEENDILQKFIQEYIANLKDEDLEDLNEKISEKFNWDISKLTNQMPADSGILCYATLTFEEGVLKTIPSFQEESEVKIAIGNTGMEALSAYVAHAFHPKEIEKKQKLEEFIESLNLSSIFENNGVDTEYKFREALNKKTFLGVNGGLLWDVKIENIEKDKEKALEEGTASSLNTDDSVLPIEVVSLLDKMNAFQSSLDKLIDNRADLRIKTFADWYKYMNSTYMSSEDKPTPLPIDDIVEFVKEVDLVELNEIEEKIEGLDQELENEKSNLSTEITRLNANDTTKKITAELKEASRYWESSEPTLLLVGEDIQQSTPFASTDLKQVYLYAVNDAVQSLVTLANPNAFLLDMNNIVKDVTESPYVFTWEKQPWNPFMLDWRVQANMHRPSKERKGIGRQYDVDFFTNYYALNEKSHNLENKTKVPRRNQLFSGRSFLTPYAVNLLNDKITARDTSPNTKGNTEIEQIKSFLEGTNCMSQSLSGFNDSLLMQKQSLVLPINEPIGFEGYRNFSMEVNKAVQESIRTASEPLNIFTPIRSGEFKINELQLIDTFGQVKKLNYENIIRSEQMINKHDTEDKDEKIYLPPRFVQPTRINFRWLKHSKNNRLIHGWLIQDRMAGTIAVYDGLGECLGSVSAFGWRPAPGDKPVLSIEKIEDEEVKKTVQRISTDFNSFFEILKLAIRGINPENFEENIELSFLLGTPIAILKATLNLELKGLPVVNHDWNMFKKDIKEERRKGKRETGAFTKVKVPIKLGEERQHNDGLVGYWIDKPTQNDIFHSEYSTNKVLPMEHALDDTAIEISILMNPLSKLHIHSGILPVKEVQIPKKHYSYALKNLKLMLMTTAVLMPKNKIALPLPTYDGFQWKWIEATNEEGQKVNEKKWLEVTCNSDDELSPMIEQQEIHDGWLALKPVNEENNNVK